MIRLASMVLALAGPVAAQTAPACDGQVVTMRVSKLKRGASMAGFEAAVAAHRAWYRGKGFADNRIVIAQVLRGGSGPSRTEVVTLHVDPPRGGSEADRASPGWQAFVAKYDAAATIETSKQLCLPRGARVVAR